MPGVTTRSQPGILVTVTGNGHTRIDLNRATSAFCFGKSFLFTASFPTHAYRLKCSPLWQWPDPASVRAPHLCTVHAAAVVHGRRFHRGPQIRIREGDSSQGLDGPVILIECGVLLMHKPIQRTRKPISSQLFRVLLEPASEWEASATNVSAILKL